MCGIVAIFSDRPEHCSASIVARMRDRLAHRGPDARSQWSGQHGRSTIAFGHRRLSIIDPRPISDQPFFAADGRVALVFNGEIFNYIELRRELEQLGVAFRTSSDTEVLLAAYLTWDEECLQRFNGQFAFVIWDGRKGAAFAARDRFGEKPFHYAALPGGGLAIASEMKALLAHPAVGDEVDLDVLREFALGAPSYCDAPMPFRSIRRLEPANAMRIGADGTILQRWRYWTPSFDPRPGSFDATRDVEEFESLLRDGVRIRMRSDVTVGASLSGGVDSSAMVALMADEGMIASGQLRHAISARFDADPSMSEGPFIDSVVARTGIHALPVTPDPLRLADEMTALHYHLEVPMQSASAYLEWCVRRKARESGLVVMLDGQGADELLGGYQTYFSLLQHDQADRLEWTKLLGNTLAFRRRLLTAARAFDEPHRRINPSVVEPLLPLLAKGAAKLMIRSTVDRSFHQPHLPHRPGLPSAEDGHQFRYAIASGVLYTSLPNQLVVADLNSMAFGVETRFPFLDHRLVDRIVSLPDEAMIRDGWTKWILRASVKNVLPADVCWRVDKLGFSAPLDKWLRGELREWASGQLFEGPVTELPFFDARALRQQWERHQSGAADLSWALWRWISVNQWLRLSRDGVWRRGLAPQIPDTAPEHPPTVIQHNG